MNKKIIFGSLLAGGFICISLLTCCGNTTSEQVVEPATTEEANTTTTQESPAPAASTSAQENVASNSVSQTETEVCTNAVGARPTIAYYETKGFEVSICGRDGDIYYNGVDKKSSNAITLPATYRNGAGYVAVNGKTTYIINESSLTVLDNGKEILNQAVISASDSETENTQAYCPDAAGGTPQIESYETKGFNVYLCGGDGEIFYHGVDKKNGNAITLPATYRNGAGCVAANGKITYIIN
ncbi:MAG: hypothetical protein WA896_05525, partial [Spirulinaceae cyanobacterium]